MKKQIVWSTIVMCVCTWSAFAQNKVVFDNQSGEPALVKLIGPTSKDVEVANNAKAGVVAAAGRYVIKVRYGTPSKYRYSKGEGFDVKESDKTRSEITITLHKVTNGNYDSHPITETDFGVTADDAGKTAPAAGDAPDALKPATYAQKKTPDALLNALRDAKTATVTVDYISNGKSQPGNKSLVSSTMDYLLKAAEIEKVKENADINLILRVENTSQSASYGSPGASLNIATGARVTGTLRIESHGVASILPFDGTRGITPTATIGGGLDKNPVRLALSESGLHRSLLDVVVVARGHEILKKILDDSRMLHPSNSDGDGQLSTYQIVFDILAESSEPWASEMLSTLEKDADSPMAKPLATQAIKRRQQNRRPENAEQRADGKTPEAHKPPN